MSYFIKNYAKQKGTIAGSFLYYSFQKVHLLMWCNFYEKQCVKKFEIIFCSTSKTHRPFESFMNCCKLVSQNRLFLGCSNIERFLLLFFRKTTPKQKNVNFLVLGVFTFLSLIVLCWNPIAIKLRLSKNPFN